MMKEFWLKNELNKQYLRLPVTPSNFNISKGNRIEVVNITELGDLNIVGTTTLGTLKIDSFFPANIYPFSLKDTINITNNYSYIDFFKDCITNKYILRFIITATNINLEVVVEDINYGENDGTGDIYYTLTLREYRRVNPIKISTSSPTTTRPSNPPKPAENKYTVKSGDTLWAISKKYYGDGSQYMKIANANNISNPNLIYPGQVLVIP